MRVAVTGSSGRVGTWAVRELLGAGHDVLCLDQNPPAEHRERWRFADLREIGRLYDLLDGCDAVLHLAAYPHPHGRPSEVTLTENVQTTWHVLLAAEAYGMRRAVVASSDCALGFPFARHPMKPLYLPMDEAHPARPQDPYGLSKLMAEEMLRAACRGSGTLSGVALRFTFVAGPDLYQARWFERRREFPEMSKGNLWSYVDARDAARACRLSLEAELPPGEAEAVFVAAPTTLQPLPTRELVAAHYGDGIEFRDEGLPENFSCLDSRRAGELFGWRAEHGWQQAAG